MTKSKKVPTKSLEKQLATWKREVPEVYDEIMEIAQIHGVLTKTGKITTAKKAQKRLAQFKSEYENKFGSYSKAKKHYRKAYKKLWSEDRPKGGFKQFMREEILYSELIQELFNSFNSESAYEEYIYLESLPRKDAIERLQKELLEHKIFPAIEYKKTYGDYEPPFD